MGSYWGFIEVSFFFILPFFLRELRRTASPLDANGLLLPAVAIQRPIKVTTAIGGGGGDQSAGAFFFTLKQKKTAEKSSLHQKKKAKAKNKTMEVSGGSLHSLSLSLFLLRPSRC